MLKADYLIARLNCRTVSSGGRGTARARAHARLTFLFFFRRQREFIARSPGRTEKPISPRGKNASVSDGNGGQTPETRECYRGPSIEFKDAYAAVARFNASPTRSFAQLSSEKSSHSVRCSRRPSHRNEGNFVARVARKFS